MADMDWFSRVKEYFGCRCIISFVIYGVKAYKGVQRIPRNSWFKGRKKRIRSKQAKHVQYEEILLEILSRDRNGMNNLESCMCVFLWRPRSESRIKETKGRIRFPSSLSSKNKHIEQHRKKEINRMKCSVVRDLLLPFLLPPSFSPASEAALLLKVSLCYFPSLLSYQRLDTKGEKIKKEWWRNRDIYRVDFTTKGSLLWFPNGLNTSSRMWH